MLSASLLSLCRMVPDCLYAADGRRVQMQPRKGSWARPENGAGHAGKGGGVAARYPRPAGMVTRLLVAVFTWRLAMSDGRQAALPGTVTGPGLQASHTPATSLLPARERTTSQHWTLSGTPLTRSRMLVPHEVAVSAATARTCAAGLAPDTVMAGPDGRPAP